MLDPVTVDDIDVETPTSLTRRTPVSLSLVKSTVLVRDSFYSRFGKRILDLLLVLASAPIVIPVVGLLALLVKRDGGPAFYPQPRVGREGRRFTCWKLRSMVPDAEAHLEAHLAQDKEARAEWDAFQKLQNDPRITPVGRFVRRSSLDELPQLWCVLRGDMSIVGPRPFLPEQEELYTGEAYYDLRPGITGLWQVNDHNDTVFAARTEFDDDYAASLSFFNDLKIMVKTVAVMLRGSGV